jgi:hypothetical protein
MKKYPDIDYSHQPGNYWDDGNLLGAILRNIKGTKRRQMIADYWNDGRLDELNDELLKDTIDAGLRERLGKIHPAFMGGEYLPDYRPGEVEIARIELESTTGDVISIRARRVSRGIRYRVVDEYDTNFVLPRKTSRQPLTLAGLIALIDGTSIDGINTGLATVYNEQGGDNFASRKSYRHFTRVGSDIYPQLGRHYEHLYDEWVELGSKALDETE